MKIINEDEQFRLKHVAIFKAQLQKASKKLGLPLTNKNLPVLAQEVRNGESTPEKQQPKRNSKIKYV